MKNIKKAFALVAAFMVISASAMEQNYTIEEYQPARDKAEVEQILKDKWSQAVWGPQGQTFDPTLANTLLNPVEPPPGSKTIDVARNAQAQDGSKIAGFITYISFEPIESENLDLRTRRGYIELLLSKNPSVDQALRTHAIEKMKQRNPEKIEEFVMKNDNRTIELLKELGFQQVREGNFARKFELNLKK